MNQTVPPSPHWGQVVTFSLAWLFSGVGVFGNSLLFAAYAKYANLRANDFIHLVMALAATDLLTSTWLFFIFAPFQLLWQLVDFRILTKTCLAILTPLSVGMTAGQVVTASISFDRITAFRDPMAYRAKNHKRYATRTLVVAFVFCLYHIGFWLDTDYESVPPVCTFGGVANPIYSKLHMLLNVSVSILVVAFYLKALFLMKKAAKTEFGKNKTEKDKKRALEREIKVTRTISFIVIIYVVSWVIPNILVFGCVLLRIPRHILGRVTPAIAIGMAVNSGVNCAVYAAKNTTIRSFMVALLTGKSNNQVMPTTAAQSKAQSRAPSR